MEVTLDNVYWQRNRLVGILARVFPSKIVWPKSAIAGEKLGYVPDDWQGWGCVYIDLPTGQISFHIPESELVQFVGIPIVPDGEKPWDGHDDEEKWRRTLKFILNCGDIEAMQLNMRVD